MPAGPATGRVEAKRRALTMPSTAPASSARWWCSSIWPTETACVLQAERGSCANRFLRNAYPLLVRIWPRIRAHGRRDLSCTNGLADSDTRHDQRWRERPRQGALGSGAGHGDGVVHAIVGAVTSARALLERGGKQRRLVVAARGNVRRVKRLPAVRAHGQPGVRECPARASKQGGQPDAIFAWPPVWPRRHGPSCR